jgi:glycosyltransferase involved in cell wall biosynthesis
MGPLRVLQVTNLFPNPQEPTRGIFVAQMVERLARQCETDVVSPLPWFPRLRPLRRFSRWDKFARIPAEGCAAGLRVRYPKHLVIPKLECLQAGALFLRLLPMIRAMHRAKRIDVLNAHWLYPDGAATAWVAKRLGLPLVLSARGCDANEYPRFPLLRPQIRSALAQALMVTVVSPAMRDVVAGLGVPASRLAVIPNGVDTRTFFPRDRRDCRLQLGLPVEGRLILFVGSLVAVKGVPVLLQAASEVVRKVPGCEIVLVGDGPMAAAYRRTADSAGLAGRLRLLPPQPHSEVARYMGAADLLCLPSLREGCPNVALEALACGRPVVASAVGGLPSLITERNGLLFPPRDSQALAACLMRALEAAWDPATVRETVAHLTWERAAEAYLQAYRTAREAHTAAGED